MIIWVFNLNLFLVTNLKRRKIKMLNNSPSFLFSLSSIHIKMHLFSRNVRQLSNIVYTIFQVIFYLPMLKIITKFVPFFFKFSCIIEVIDLNINSQPWWQKSLLLNLWDGHLPLLLSSLEIYLFSKLFWIKDTKNCWLGSLTGLVT